MGIYEDLLIPGTHKWERVAIAINRMVHHHKITKQIAGERHLVPLGLLDLTVFLGATGDCKVANEVMVRAHVPPLYLVQPGDDVVQIVDQVRIVGAAVGRGDERDHMDRVVKQLRELTFILQLNINYRVYPLEKSLLHTINNTFKI
jgi:hypothetical protein